jgi:hypothetical protein
MTEIILKLAQERGARGETFATQEELATPGYGEKWVCARLQNLINEAVANLRWDGVPHLNAGEMQHRANLAIYALQEALRLLKD